MAVVLDSRNLSRKPTLLSHKNWGATTSREQTHEPV